MRKKLLLILIVVVLSSTGCVEATLYGGKLSVDFSVYNSSDYSANFDIYKAGE